MMLPFGFQGPCACGVDRTSRFEEAVGLHTPNNGGVNCSML